MIDGRGGSWLDALWERLAHGLVGWGFSPNAVTCAGGLLVGAACLAYPWHGMNWLFGLWLALAFAFDGLDGAVARVSGRASHVGGYLDAVVDRYQEVAVFAAVAYVHDVWLAAFVAASGSLLFSYHKARAALEMPIDNGGWPDLMERLERIVLIVAMLLSADLAPRVGLSTAQWLGGGLLLLGTLVHLSALQRLRRALSRLADHDRTRR